MKIIMSLLVFQTLVISGLAQEPVGYDSVVVDCLDLGTPGPRQFVINSQEDMEMIRNLRSRFPMQFLPPGEECSDLTSFDFSTKTLIGYVVSVGSCPTPNFEMTFTKNNDTYLVRVLVETFGVCRRGYTEFYWMLTDKIPDASLVQFETKYK